MSSLPSDHPSASHHHAFWPRLAILVWTLAYFALCGRTLLLKHDPHSVYPVFTTAAEHWLTGSNLYVRGGTEEFRYSPLVAAAFVPFHLLPERLGHFCWRSINFIALLVGIAACCQVGIPRRFTINQTAAVFLLALPLSIGSLNNAQSNPLVLGLLLISIAAVADRRWTLCAAAIVIATLFKVYPFSLGMLLVLIYPARLGWRLAVCLAAGLMLPFLLQHAAYVIDQYHIWIHYLLSEDRQRGPIADWYKDFRALWRVYVHSMPAYRYLLLEFSVAALIAVVLLLARLRRWPMSSLLALALSLACCWMTALGPGTESSTYILLAPTVAWTLVEADAISNPTLGLRLLRIGYGIVFGLFLAAQAALWFGAPGKWMRDHLQPLPIAGTLLLVLLLIDAAATLARPTRAQALD